MEKEKKRSYIIWTVLRSVCEVVSLLGAFMIMRWLTDIKIISFAEVSDFQAQCLGYMAFTFMISHFIYRVIIPFASLVDDLFQF